MENPKKTRPREDWVTRNMREKTENPIKWAYGVTPDTASGDSPRKNRPGAGRPKGVHTKWRSKEERELDKAWRELHPNKHEDVAKWPGPFQKRTDFNSVRPAYWLNCPICNVLFLSNVSESRTPNISRHNGQRATRRFCSLACAGNSKAKPIFRVCSYCARTFRVYMSNYNRLTCCMDCRDSVIGDKAHQRLAMPLVAYAFEHGIKADMEALQCEVCHNATQKNFGSLAAQSKGNNHWNIRLTEINGHYVARCKKCYQRSYNDRLAAEGKLTPAQKLRRAQAQVLIDGVMER